MDAEKTPKIAIVAHAVTLKIKVDENNDSKRIFFVPVNMKN